MTLESIGTFFDDLVAKFDAFWNSVLAFLGLIDDETAKLTTGYADVMGDAYTPN